MVTKYLPTLITHDFFREKVFLILDGDMQTNYIFEEEKLTVRQEKDVSFMKECVKEAYGVEIPAYIDGGSGGKREDQEICAYREYLQYYMSSVFYLPNKSIPEKLYWNPNTHNSSMGILLRERERYQMIMQRIFS